jgi:type I restriction enzyme S subunit
VNPTFLAYWIGSEKSQRWLGRVEKGVAYIGINIEDLRTLPVELPPMDEQREIVRRVESLLVYADRFEGRHQTAQASVEQLTPTLLAKAFRGELVPQDPADEPASVLLERIRAEHAISKLQGKKLIRKTHMAKKTSKKEVPTAPTSIVEALRTAGRELSGEELLDAAGYPSDADSELVEAFLVDVRDALKRKDVTRERRSREDWFSLTNP